jgi:hypothetical protein
VEVRLVVATPDSHLSPSGPKLRHRGKTFSLSLDRSRLVSLEVLF